MGGICFTNFNNMRWTTDKVKKLCRGLEHIEMITIANYGESDIDFEELEEFYNLNI